MGILRVWNPWEGLFERKKGRKEVKEKRRKGEKEEEKRGVGRYWTRTSDLLHGKQAL